MLAVSVLGGCGSKKSNPDTNQKNTSEEKDKQKQEQAEKEKAENKQETQDKQEPEKETDETQTAKENEPVEAEDNVNVDLILKSLKEQAGTHDYTALEELNLEPGSRIAVVVKSTKTGFWKSVKKGMDAAVTDLNEKMGYKGEDKIKLTFE